MPFEWSQDAFLRPFSHFGGHIMSLIQVSNLTFAYDKRTITQLKNE